MENVIKNQNESKNKKGAGLVSARGITLIALVFTIVILIILAGVAISLSLGENGIFSKAQQARQEYLNAQDYEETEIAKYTNEIDKITGNRENINLEITDLSNQVVLNDNTYIDNEAEGYLNLYKYGKLVELSFKVRFTSNIPNGVTAILSNLPVPKCNYAYLIGQDWSGNKITVRIDKQGIASVFYNGLTATTGVEGSVMYIAE